MFHGDRSGALLAAECVKIARATVGVQLVIAPPFTALTACAAECLGSPLGLAAQDIHPQERGPCTGGVGAQTIKDIGCTWVIIGHSERRRVLAETDEMVVESYVQRRRHLQAAARGAPEEAGHYRWGWGGDFVWLIFVVGVIWVMTALWWPYGYR
jgi:triosephosphate isomerase